jgi:3-deoxy-manno-octulosonate cytidylyltransferase (CMP-KDO synthetase)
MQLVQFALFFNLHQEPSAIAGATFLPKGTCADPQHRAKIKRGILMKVEAAIAIIPARFGSTRFPGKLLSIIEGKTLIELVYRRVEQARFVGRILVATDDQRISDTVRRFGGTAVMTRNDHPSGTDRLAEAAQDFDSDSLVVNVQGDEPMIEPSDIDRAITAAGIGDAEMVTLMTRLDPAQADDPNRVKVVTDRNGIALYFSRSRIPSGGTCFLHLGLYVYRVAFLKRFMKLERTPLEIAERLEQLRALEHGYRIRVVEVESESWGIDTPEDLERFCKLVETVAIGGQTSKFVV